MEPRKEYEQRIEARVAEAARHFQRFRRVGVVRLAFVAIAIVLLFLTLSGLSFWWLLGPVIGVVLLGPVQQSITAARKRSERAAALYHDGLMRLDDRWAGKGASGERFLNHAHAYAADLDVFGVGSLFELLSRARTRVGEDTLAHWLLAPATTDVIRERQASVSELRSALDLREDLALLGEGIHTGSDAQLLTEWVDSPAWKVTSTVIWAARVLALLGAVGLSLWTIGFGASPFFIAVLIGQIFVFRFRADIQRVISSVDGPGKDLQLLVDVLRRLEQERFTSPHLVKLRAELDVEGLAPSQQIARLKRLIELLDSRRNLFFAPFAQILLWPMQCAIAIEQWRQLNGPAVAGWLAVVGELEALSSLAGYAFERPDDPFPELIEHAVCFDGEALGHPLIPESQNVRTNLSLGDTPSVLVVSGSNMSGKSTLLRTVGTNTILALAGAPVRARRLRLSPVQIAASIRIQDSLMAGTSKFYVEITRLRQIVELTSGPLPVLFLLDEILHGTNSHDRKIGAEGVVRGLVERGAIGLVTTHDLALTQIVEQLGDRAANVHFEDHLEGGKMSFDYLLRPGVLQKSNALELMRSVGLEI